MPDRIFRARCARVLTPNLIEADIDLGLGVRVTRRVVLGQYPVPLGAGEAAMHCLVLLIGGKTVYLKVDDETIDGHLRGIVYSTAVRFVAEPAIPVEEVGGLRLRNVVNWMLWSAANGHSHRHMQSAAKE